VGRIVITLRKDGSIKSEAFDIEGPGCEERMSFLDGLFGEPLAVERKPEYYSEQTTQDRLTNGLCG